MRLKAFLTAVVCVLATAGHAAVIDFDEAIDGDLPNFDDTPASFTIDTVGVNSWSGSSATPTADSGTFELDYFEVSLAPGLEIADYSLSLTNVQELPGSNPAGAINAIVRITATDLLLRYATLQVGDSPEATNPVPLPWTDPLAIRTSYARGSETYFSYDWEVTLTAAVVPLPASFPMLGMAVLLLGGVLRSRSRAA